MGAQRGTTTRTSVRGELKGRGQRRRRRQTRVGQPAHLSNRSASASFPPKFHAQLHVQFLYFCLQRKNAVPAKEREGAGEGQEGQRCLISSATKMLPSVSGGGGGVEQHEVQCVWDRSEEGRGFQPHALVEENLCWDYGKCFKLRTYILIDVFTSKLQASLLKQSNSFHTYDFQGSWKCPTTIISDSGVLRDWHASVHAASQLKREQKGTPWQNYKQLKKTTSKTQSKTQKQNQAKTGTWTKTQATNKPGHQEIRDQTNPVTKKSDVSIVCACKTLHGPRV